MYKLWFKKTFVVATVSLLSFTAARSADISTTRGMISLSGEIVTGDAERFATSLQLQKPVVFLNLNSPGGDLQETMRIVSLVKGAHLEIEISKGKYCISSCFFLFVAARYRMASAARDDGSFAPQSKRDNLRGVVGVHRPYFKNASGNVSVVEKQEVMMLGVRKYLSANGVAQYIIDEMMSRPSNDVYWLREADLERIGEYSAGDEEAVIEKCGYKRFDMRERENWSEERRAIVMNCELDFWFARYMPLQKQFIVRLQTGWRPWKKMN